MPILLAILQAVLEVGVDTLVEKSLGKEIIANIFRNLMPTSLTRGLEKSEYTDLKKLFDVKRVGKNMLKNLNPLTRAKTLVGILRSFKSENIIATLRKKLTPAYLEMIMKIAKKYNFQHPKTAEGLQKYAKYLQRRMYRNNRKLKDEAKALENHYDDNVVRNAKNTSATYQGHYSKDKSIAELEADVKEQERQISFIREFGNNPDPLLLEIYGNSIETV